MKQEKLVKLLCELIKNSRRSDRDLAKILGFSQPSVSRLRKVLEKEAILQYTAIPDFSYLGFDLIVFTFYRLKEPLQPIMEKAAKWLMEQPNVVFSSEGQGMEADRVMISVHRDYADFSEFHQKFRKEMGLHLESFKTFLVSLRGHEISKLFTFKELAIQAIPNFSIIDSQRRRWKRSIPSNLLRAGPVLDFREGDSIIATYTSAADKMKVFSAFIREGLESGDAVWYTYPDEESETVRAMLEEQGIDWEEYERDGTLHLTSLTEIFMPNGKLDFEKVINMGLNWWAEAKRKRFNHVRVIEDVGDFSFVNGQWQKYVKEYWLDPRWNDPAISEWVEPKEPRGARYKPFLMEITAINVEHMSEAQIRDILKAFGGGEIQPTRFIDLLEYADAFSKRIGLSHHELIGRKFLLEFDPSSDYEVIVEDFAKELMANVEPIYVFTSTASTLHKCLAKYLAIKFFLTSISTSTIQPESENEVLIPANDIDLLLDSVDNVTKAHLGTNMSIVFDGLSDLLSSFDPERTFTFLRHILQMLSSERITVLFLLNTNAHDLKIVSRLRSMFYNQLIYSKAGLQAVKLSKVE
jgi:DNA-binding Lrp family transcriptional regulator